MNENNYLAKFVFLAVMIGVVLFSQLAYPAAAPTNLAQVSGGIPPQNTAVASVPLFSFPPTTVSADANTTIVTTTNDAAATAAGVALPKLQSTASLAADLTTGTVYESVNANDRWPTASIAKLMSATIVADKMDPAAKITITSNMFAADIDEYTLVVGGTYTVNDLLRLMLMPSSNVAAEAVATYYGRDAFIAEMNARAAAWGMANTHFDDPSGISAGDQSTANDLLALAKKIYTEYPQLLAITRTQQYDITEQNSGKQILIKSINEFAGEPDFIGGKTGHTEQADGNLLSLFRDGSQVYCIIVIGTNDRFGDTQKLYDWVKKA